MFLNMRLLGDSEFSDDEDFDARYSSEYLAYGILRKQGCY